MADAEVIDAHTHPAMSAQMLDQCSLADKALAFAAIKAQIQACLRKDPGEETDVAASEPEKLAEIKQAYDAMYAKLPVIEPYGGVTLKEGGSARGPLGPTPAPSASAKQK